MCACRLCVCVCVCLLFALVCECVRPVLFCPGLMNINKSSAEREEEMEEREEGGGGIVDRTGQAVRYIFIDTKPAEGPILKEKGSDFINHPINERWGRPVKSCETLMSLNSASPYPAD